MPTTVKVFSATEEISTYKVLSLLVSEQSQVSAQQPICELETDKVVIEIDAPQAGQIRWLVAAGAEVNVGDPLCVIE